MIVFNQLTCNEVSDATYVYLIHIFWLSDKVKLFKTNVIPIICMFIDNVTYNDYADQNTYI